MDQMTDKYNRKLHDISICCIKGSRNFEEFMGFVALSENYISWQENVQENKNKKTNKKTSTQENKECIMLVKQNDYETSHVRIYIYQHIYIYIYIYIHSCSQ